MSLVEYKKKDHLVTITMNRPDKLNALDADMLTGLRESWIRYRDDDEAWLAIFTGTGKAFSAGADKSWFIKGLQGEDFLVPFVNTISKDPYWSEIEQVITSFETVQECAVIGVADDDRGGAVKAVVELSPGKTVSDKEIIVL